MFDFTGLDSSADHGYILPQRADDYGQHASPSYNGTYTAVQTGDANSGGGVTGFLERGIATAESLVKLWGGIQAVGLHNEQQRAAIQTAKGQVQIDSAKAETARDLALISANTTRSVAELQASAQIADAQARADAARSGRVTLPVAVSSLSKEAMLGIGALLMVGFFAFGRKAK